MVYISHCDVVKAFFKWRVRISVSTPDFLRLDLIRKKSSLVLILVRMKKVQYLTREPFWQGRFDSATRYKCPSDEKGSHKGLNYLKDNKLNWRII